MYIVFDIGATNTRFACSSDLETLDKIIIRPTPQDYDEAIDLIKEMTDELCKDDLEGISGGIPGVLCENRRCVLESPNLPLWEEKTIVKDLKNILGKEPIINNDADLGGLGEAVYGAGKDGKIVVYMTLSTGVGGTLIHDKKIVRHHLGFEPGFQILDPENNLNFEQLVSGKNVEKRYGMKPQELEQTDAWEEVLKWMAIGIHNTVVLWSPDTLVIGGGMVNHVDIKELRDRVENLAEFFPYIPKMVKSELGTHNGLYGAMALLKQKMEKGKKAEE